MNERILKKWCAVCGSGAALLLLLLPASIEEHSIELSGTIEEVSNVKGMTFFRLRPDEPLHVMSYNSLSLRVGQQIRVSGSLKKYDGMLEILATRIE
ncbi:hypothetical protein GF342_05745 [Candidatus Woesearchaeota archaeon]|nr:hypothetical protein [Candidatus Woesearchaeota archaeon]